MCVLFWSLNKTQIQVHEEDGMHKSSQYKKWNEKCCRWDILIVLFLHDFLCICMCGMDILDGEGFKGRFMPSPNNTTYSDLCAPNEMCLYW